MIFIYGSFDLLNINEINLLEQCKLLANDKEELAIVIYDKVTSFHLNLTVPVFSLEHRKKSLLSNKYVNKVFSYNFNDSTSLITENKPSTIINFPFKNSAILEGYKFINIPLKDDPETKFISPKSYSLFLNGTYTVPPAPISDIFPLKKYIYHGRKLWGPRTFKTMEKYYQKLMPAKKKDIMKYGYRKTSRIKTIFTITNKSPAKIILNHNDDLEGCNKNTERCKSSTVPCRVKKGNRIENLPISICCATHIVEILFYVTDILEKHGITYFIYWGTLLGAMRHKGLIPWDRDADLYILETEKSKVVALKEEFNKKYFMSFVNKNFLRVCYSKSNFTHLDIYIANIIQNPQS